MPHTRCCYGTKHRTYCPWCFSIVCGTIANRQLTITSRPVAIAARMTQHSIRRWAHDQGPSSLDCRSLSSLRPLRYRALRCLTSSGMRGSHLKCVPVRIQSMFQAFLVLCSISLVLCLYLSVVNNRITGSISPRSFGTRIPSKARKRGPPFPVPFPVREGTT